MRSGKELMIIAMICWGHIVRLVKNVGNIIAISSIAKVSKRQSLLSSLNSRDIDELLSMYHMDDA